METGSGYGKHRGRVNPLDPWGNPLGRASAQISQSRCWRQHEIKSPSCPYVRKRTEHVRGNRHYEDRSGVEYFTPPYERKTTMLYTIAVVLVILWLLGLVSSYTMGGFIHVLLVIAIVLVLLRVISGRSAL